LLKSFWSIVFRPSEKIVVFTRKVENGIHLLAHIIVEARNYDAVQILFDFFGAENSLSSDQRVNQQQRLDNRGY